MGVTLLIAADPGHVAALRAEGLLGRPGTLVLAATARARYACDRAGVESVCPEAFYDEQGLNEAGNWVEQLLGELELRLDPLLLDLYPAFKRLDGAGPVGLAWWELHRLLSPYAAALYILRRVLAGIRPSRIVGFSGPPARNFVLDYPLSSPWPPILKLLGSREGIVVEERPEPGLIGATPRRDSATAWSGQVERHGRQLLNFARWLSTGCLGGGQGAAPVLVLGTLSEDVSALIREIVERSGRPVWRWDLPEAPLRIVPPSLSRLPIERPSPAHTRASLGPRLVAELWFQKATTYEGVCLGGVLAPALDSFCDEKVPDLARTVDVAEVVLDRLKPVYLLSAYSHRREHLVQRLATLRGIPAVEYNHGVGLMASSMESAASPLAYHRAWRWTSHVLAQGDGVKDYMEKWHKAGEKTIAIGSTHLDQIRKNVRAPGAREKARKALGLDGDRPVVVYSANASEGLVRFPPHRARSSWRQWLLEERILAAAAACPGVQFVIKAYPHNDFPVERSPLAEAIRDRNYRNCRIVQRPPLPAVLPAADLLISDCPFLSFFEMLTTDLPVVLCGWEMPWPFRAPGWHPDTVPMWGTRVIHLEMIEDIDKVLPDLFRRLPLPPVTDDLLLRTFGTHLNDGRSAARAQAVIEGLIRGAEAARPVAR